MLGGKLRKRRTRARKSATSSSAKALPSDSIGTAWRTLRKRPAGFAPTLRRRASPARDQLRKARLDRGVALPERVVFGVGDGRRVLLVVAPVVLGDLGGEPLQLRRRLRFGQLVDWSAGLPRPDHLRFLPIVPAGPSFRLRPQAAPFISRSAAARASSEIVAPASMRAISSRRAVAGDRLDARRDALAPVHARLGDEEMRLGLRGDLRRMRDGENLHALGEPRQPPADRLGDGAAGAGIDLVENQRRRRAAIGERHLQRQQEARQLAARGDLHQRPGLRARIGADMEGDAVEAFRRDARLVGLERHDEARRLQLQRRKLGVHRRLQGMRRLRAAARKASRPRAV